MLSVYLNYLGFQCEKTVNYLLDGYVLCGMWVQSLLSQMSVPKIKKILQKKLSKFYFIPKIKSTAKFSYSNNKKNMVKV